MIPNFLLYFRLLAEERKKKQVDWWKEIRVALVYMTDLAVTLYPRAI